MEKILIGAAAGIFIGALVVEIIRKVNPQYLESIEKSAGQAAHAIASSFREGYRGVPGMN